MKWLNLKLMARRFASPEQYSGRSGQIFPSEHSQIVDKSGGRKTGNFCSVPVIRFAVMIIDRSVFNSISFIYFSFQSDNHAYLLTRKQLIPNGRFCNTAICGSSAISAYKDHNNTTSNVSMTTGVDHMILAVITGVPKPKVPKGKAVRAERVSCFGGWKTIRYSLFTTNIQERFNVRNYCCLHPYHSVYS